VPTFVRRVPVATTKTAMLALGVNLHVVLEQEKQLLVLHRLIEYVPKIRAVVPTVTLLLEALVPQTVPTFVRLVLVDSTKRATHVLDVDLLVVLEQDKQLLVHRPPIVYVPKMYVPVPTVLKLLELLVLRMTPTLVPPVRVDITKQGTLVLDVELLVVLGRQKRLRVLRQLIVYVQLN